MPGEGTGGRGVARLATEAVGEAGVWGMGCRVWGMGRGRFKQWGMGGQGGSWPSNRLAQMNLPCLTDLPLYIRRVARLAQRPCHRPVSFGRLCGGDARHLLTSATAYLVMCPKIL